MWPFTRGAKKLAALDDSVWYGYDAMCEGVAQRAIAALGSGKVLVVAQFSESVEDAEAALTGAGGRCERLAGPLDARGIRDALLRMDQGVAALLHSAVVRPVDAPGDPGPGEKDGPRPGLSVMVWERHPLRIYDDRGTDLAAKLNEWFACELRFNAALDRPPLSMFSGEATRSILERLGMKATDSIENPMLSRSVERAQAKVAEKAGADPKPGAVSALDWFEAWKRAAGSS